MLAPTKLLEHKTHDYDASNYVWGFGTLWYYNYRRKPPFRRLFHVPAMLANWRIQIALQVFEGAITSFSHFFVKEENDEIKQFVIAQIERWWRNAAAKMIYGALPYGFYGAEILYRVDIDGRLAYKGLKSFQPHDIYPVTFKGEFVGIQIRNYRGSKVRYIGGEKAFWHVHWRQWQPWYGQSRFYGAYEPWLDLTSEGGALDVRRLYFYRNVLQNDMIRHPDKAIQDEEGNLVHTRDIARSMVEKQRSGGAYTLPSTTDMNGNRDWDVETKDTTGGGQQVLDNVAVLADEIAEGIGISPEIFRAAETGSGFSGRKIPESAFRGILTNIVQEMVCDIDDQCFRPLVKEAFKVEPSYSIVPFGLVRDEEEGAGENDVKSVNNKERSKGGTTIPRKNLKMAYENGDLCV